MEDKKRNSANKDYPHQRDVKRIIGDALTDARKNYRRKGERKRITQETLGLLMDKEYKFYPSYASIRKYEQGDKACPVDKFFLLAIVLDLDTEKLKEDIARFLTEQPK